MERGNRVISSLYDGSTWEVFENFLAEDVFGQDQGITITPSAEEIAGYQIFMRRYREGIDIEKTAIHQLQEKGVIENAGTTERRSIPSKS